MRTRTPPPTSPNGYEKSTVEVRVKCTVTEKLFWQAAFGGGQLSENARKLLHDKAHELTGIPKSSILTPT